MIDQFEVDTQLGEGYAFLRTKGYLNNLGGEKIAEESYRLMDTGVRHLVMNLEGTKVVNSIGISILIEIIERTLEIHGTLSFCGLTTTIAKTFKIMGLFQYTRQFDDEEQAAQFVEQQLSGAKSPTS